MKPVIKQKGKLRIAPSAPWPHMTTVKHIRTSPAHPFAKCSTVIEKYVIILFWNCLVSNYRGNKMLTKHHQPTTKVGNLGPRRSGQRCYPGKPGGNKTSVMAEEQLKQSNVSNNFKKWFFKITIVFYLLKYRTFIL